jgi:hypothetical protein
MTLNLFAFFHLNLMFSSIPEERRPEVIEKAYWPLLDLPRRIGAPIGVEATGLTLDIAAKIDPAWIAVLKERIADGRIEFIGSGYAQLIGPLVPSKVVAQNLHLGTKTYWDVLGLKPKIALVNEQAYSGGLVPHYRAAGYEAILMDWDNLAPHHPDWPAETRFKPRRALGADGSALPLLWSQTLTFQRLQRYAHGELSLQDYLETILAFRSQTPRTLCIYSNDAEVFDIRPGRLHTEDRVSEESEWDRIAAAWSRLAQTEGVRIVAPSAALARLDPGSTPLRLETAAYPIPVKKQPKYNVARWAVAGRDNLTINAACERIAAAIANAPHATEQDWKDLCRFWSSDFRTHIGEARWTELRHDLRDAERRWDCPVPSVPGPAPQARPRTDDRWIEIETPALRAVLNRRRGLALQSLEKTGDTAPPMLISLLHGHFHDIALQADWYTGNAVFEALDGPKVTDLEWAQTQEWTCPSSGDVVLETTLPTRKGPIFKRVSFAAEKPRIVVDEVFHWPDPGRGSLRAAHILLNPKAFAWPDLTLETANGGPVRESFNIGRTQFDHSAAVSFQVSATTGLGATDGFVRIFDGRRGFSIWIDRTVAPLLVMAHNTNTAQGPFCRILLSAMETDDTRKPDPGPAPPIHVRYAIELD